MAVLAPGTPTNTVAGEPTTDFGESADTIFPLLHVDPAEQMSTARRARRADGTRRCDCAADARRRPRLLRAGIARGPGAVAGAVGPRVARRHRRRRRGDRARAMGDPESRRRRPAPRVSRRRAALWPAADVRVRRVGGRRRPTRSRRSKGVSASGRCRGAPTRPQPRASRAAALPAQTRAGCWRRSASHAPTRHWNARAIADLYQLQALRLAFGLAPLDTTWDGNTARALRDVAAARADRTCAGRSDRFPGPPRDELEDIALLRSLPTMQPEPLYGARRGRSSDWSAI